MYCFIQIKDNRFERTAALSDEQGSKLAFSIRNIHTVIDLHKRLLQVRGALDDLDVWCQNASLGSEQLVQNQNDSERLCRAFLLAFKTYLDHTQTSLSHTFGKDSEALATFKEGTHQAFDNSEAYRFVYQLRNYSQHCENIVHTFAGSVQGYAMPSCYSASLLAEFDDWKAINRTYMQQHERIALPLVFGETFNALGYVHTPVVRYLLAQNGTADDIMYLRKWAEALTEGQANPKDEIRFWHFAQIQHSDGTDFTEREMRDDNIDREYIATMVDWTTLLDLTDAMGVSQTNDSNKETTKK